MILNCSKVDTLTYSGYLCRTDQDSQTSFSSVLVILLVGLIAIKLLRSEFIYVYRFILRHATRKENHEEEVIELRSEGDYAFHTYGT